MLEYRIRSPVALRATGRPAMVNFSKYFLCRARTFVTRCDGAAE